MRLLKTALFFAPALGLPFLASCAVAFPPNARQTLMPAQAALVQTTCADAMRLKGWQQEFEGCVESLSQTAAYQVRYELLRKSYADCIAAGSKRDTPQFSSCVLDRRDAYESRLERDVASAPAYATPVLLDRTADTTRRASETFFDGGFAGERRKEEHACAALSLEPGSESFGHCVANLDLTIFNIEHPPG